MPENNKNPRPSQEGPRCVKSWRTMHIFVLLILLTSGLSTQAADYRRYINKRTRPLHDLLIKKQFLIIANPPTCKTNHLMRGYFISRYRAIYLCVDNLLEDPRLGDISGRDKFNDAKKQLSKIGDLAPGSGKVRGCAGMFVSRPPVPGGNSRRVK